MKLKVLLVLALTFSFSNFIHAQEVKPSKFGKGIINIVDKDSTWSMKFGARMQFLGSVFTYNDNNVLKETNSSFLIRRARLKFDGFAFSPNLVYKIELGVSNRDMSGSSIYTHNTPRIIMDAVMKWKFHKGFQFWFGQTKLPGNRGRVISSANLQLVDRSILNAAFNIDRDIGLQLHHQNTIGNHFVMRQIVAVSQGEGRNVTTGNLGGLQYTTRLEFLPFGEFKDKGDYFGSDLSREDHPKLSLAAGYDFNNNAVRTRSNMGTYMVTDSGFHKTNIGTVFIDGMFKYKGVSFMTEYADRTASDPIARNSDGTETGETVLIGNALNLQMGYLFKSNWEIAGRYATTNFDKEITGRGTENEYTAGVSKYIVKHKLKVQTDLGYLTNASNKDMLLYRLQFEMHF
ncbi:porin [Formosa haliotis]|uniref:porin n=1 Tax=Formosa haliotis TaxID=1555194 RepID=UPI00082534C7|nr:porin [Formosa haliotis]